MLQKVRLFFEVIGLAFWSELKRIVLDPGAMLVLFGALIIYPLIYSIAYKNNVLRDIPVAVVDLDHSSLSRKMTNMLDATQQLETAVICGSMKDAQNLFWDGKVNGIILLPDQFGRDLLKGNQTNVGVYCDASYFLMYKETLTGALSATSTLGAGVEIQRLLAAGNTMEQAMIKRDPLPLNIHTLYNPAGSYGSYLMPGLILVILQQTLLVGIGLVGGAKIEKMQEGAQKINKRIQQGLFSAIIGRSFAYFSIYAFNMVFTLAIIYKWFEFPDKATIENVLITVVPFIFSTIFLGLSISHLFKRREHSIMFLVFLSPLVLFLTGMSWPSESIPKILTTIAYVFPTNIVVPAYLRIRTMGVELHNIAPALWMLLTQMCIYLVLAAFTLKLKRKRLAKAAAVNG